jgi:hypothetical protein
MVELQACPGCLGIAYGRTFRLEPYPHRSDPSGWTYRMDGFPF